MNAIGKKPRKSMASPSKKDKEADSRSVQIILTQVERELLLKACLKFRYTIPAYIRSRQAEVDALDNLVGKLS